MKIVAKKSSEFLPSSSIIRPCVANSSRFPGALLVLNSLGKVKGQLQLGIAQRKLEFYEIFGIIFGVLLVEHRRIFRRCWAGMRCVCGMET